MFDLPTGTKAEKKGYTDFRKFLCDDGYTMEQFSVYSRPVLSRDSADAHIARLRSHIPPAGHVVAFQMTEKQYSSRLVLAGQRRKREADIADQLTLVF